MIRSTSIPRCALAFGLTTLAAACGGGAGRSPEAPPAVAPPGAAKMPAAPAPLSATAVLGADKSAITFDRMSRYPEPGWNVPRAMRYSPDGKRVTFLQSESGTEQMALFGFDVASRKVELLVRAADVLAETRPLSREEELRRERQRQRIQGVTDYRWAREAPVMVLPLGGDVFVRAGDGKISRLTDTAEPEIDPQPCPSGRRVAFARGSELFVVDVPTGKETALTRGAPEGVTRGQSDFNGQEEFDEPSGFWWAPGCDKIAYLEVDERGVATEPVLGFRGDKPDLMMQRYPIAGKKNPIVRAGVVDLATRKTTWLTWPAGERYLGRFAWAPDGKALWLEALSRDQKRLALVRADPATGAVTEIAAQTSATWVDFAPLELLEKSPRLLWTTVVDGHRHLEMYDAARGARVGALTSGAWDVESIDGVDEAAGVALVTGTRDGPLERHLYAVPLAGGAAPARLTPEPGVHRVAVAPAGGGFVDLHSAADRLPRAVVRGAGGSAASPSPALGELPSRVDPDLAALGLRPVEPVTVPIAGGGSLHGAMLRPRQLEPGRRYPAVVMVYGGPGHQAVTNSWSPRLLWQHLADRGFVVFQIDNRGSAGRGPAFEAPIHRRLGEIELADQLAGLDWLTALPFVDAQRVGIYGHSYGGFMAALAMLKAPGRFRVGISASPVTDWKLYDTGYTERFMGTPAENADGYAAGDLARLAPALQGKLFIIHALMDENVHFGNTAHLVDALVAADEDFDLLVFPGERHGYRSPAAKRYALRRVVDYLAANL